MLILDVLVDYSLCWPSLHVCMLLQTGTEAIAETHATQGCVNKATNTRNETLTQTASLSRGLF